MDYNIEAIKDYIQVKHPYTMKNNDILAITLFTFMWALLSLVVCHIHILFQLFIVIMSSGIIYWGWLESKDVEKYQVIHILYLGVSSLVLSLIFYLDTIAAFENMFHSDPVQIAITTGIGYLSILVFGFPLHILLLKRGFYSKKKQKKFQIVWLFIPALPGVMLFFNQAMKSIWGQSYLNATAFSMPFLSYCLLCGAHNIYKYYLIKKYEPYVHIHQLGTKRSPVSKSVKK